MRIHIKADGHNIRIPVPTSFLFSRASVWLWLKLGRLTARYSRQHIGKISEKAEGVFAGIPDEAVMTLCAELMKIKRKYGKWKLLEVSAASGERVEITL